MKQISQALVGQAAIDVENDWREQTEYDTRGVDETVAGQVIGWFWNVVKGLTAEQQSQLLKFSTGADSRSKMGQFELEVSPHRSSMPRPGEGGSLSIGGGDAEQTGPSAGISRKARISFSDRDRIAPINWNMIWVVHDYAA